MAGKIKESERREHRLVIDEPFPLRKKFRTWILPALFVFVLGTTLLSGYGAKIVIERLYVEFAEQRALGIALAVESTVPAAWSSLLEGSAADSVALQAAIDTEKVKLGLTRLRIFRLEEDALFDGRIVEILDSGEKVYKIIVAVGPEAIKVPLAFEMYEPVGYLDDLLLRNTMLPMAPPAAMLLLLVLALTQLVIRAQTDIDLRTAALISMRERLESLVSVDAVSAVHDAGALGDLRSRRLTTTLVYTDVRDFTGYAESNSPEDVIGFLNRIIALQIEAVTASGGDVDKMIGDAVLARFDGDGRAVEAMAAAREIQARLGGADLPRNLGIGVFTGEVVTGAVGHSERRDYTIIGDSVNVAARLSSLAQGGEILVDTATAQSANIDGLGTVEEVAIRGRDAPLEVYRLRGG